MSAQQDNTIKAAVILVTGIIVAACIVFTGLSNVATSILRAGNEIGSKISNKNHIRVDVSPVEKADR